MDRVAKQVGVEQPAHWKSVGTAAVKRLGGSGLLDRYGGSVARVLEACYPEVEWKQWQVRRRLACSRWSSPENRKKFFLQLAAEFGIEKPSDWKRVSNEVIRARGGALLLQKGGTPLCSLLAEAFPGEEFDESLCRPRVSRGYWESPASRRLFLERVMEELGMDLNAAWAGLTREAIEQRGGAGLLARYSNSVYRMLRATFPELAKLKAAAAGRKLPQGYWDDRGRQARFMADAAAAFQVERAEDWRRVTTAMLVDRGGAGLIQRYASLTAAIADLWRPAVDETTAAMPVDVFGCRRVIPAEYWEEKENVKNVIHRVAAELHLSSVHDWARVSQQELREQNAFSLLKHMSLLEALRIAYPREEWSSSDLERPGGRRAVQRHLATQMQRLLPATKVLEDHKHALKRESQLAVELDVYLPEHNVALEYNGEHHYQEIPFFGPLEVIQRRDEEKRRLCAEGGIRLIEVPYWWDRSLPSLAATLHRHVPSLLPSS